MYTVYSHKIDRNVRYIAEGVSKTVLIVVILNIFYIFLNCCANSGNSLDWQERNIINNTYYIYSWTNYHMDHHIVTE